MVRVFENGMLRIFGPKKDELTREWIRLHNEELNDLCSSTKYSGDEIEKSEMGGARSTYGGEERCVQGLRRVYSVLVGKPEGRRPLGRPMLRWENKIKMDLQDIG